MKAKVHLSLNVDYQLRDADGNIKPLFQENTIGRFLRGLGLNMPKLSLFGNWTSKLSVANLITEDGFAGMASRCNGSGAEDAFTYIAVGTGVTGADVGDSSLETELAAAGLTRASASVSLITTDTTDDTAQLSKEFAVTGTQAVTESGVLNASSNGVLLSRQTFSAINVVDGDTLTITWKIDFDA